MLQLTLKNHIKALERPFFFIMVLLVILLVNGFDPDFFIFIFVAILIDTIPTFILHINYYLRNNEKKYLIDAFKIIQIIGDNKIEIFPEDIEKIIIFKSASMKKGGIQILSMESYHYSKIQLKTGGNIYLTSLLSPQIDKELGKLKNVKLITRNTFYCYII